MQFERFVARDVRSALSMVRAQMGDDAVIVATRSLQAASLFRRGQVEVLATPASTAVAPPRADRPKERRESADNAPPADTQAVAEAPTVAARAASARPYAPVSGTDARGPDVAPSGWRAYGQAATPHTPELTPAWLEALAPLREEIQAVRAALAGGQRPQTASGQATVDAQLTELKELLRGVNLGGMSLAKAAQSADRAILEAADVDPEVAEALLGDLTASAKPSESLGDTARRLKRGIAFALPTVGDFFKAGTSRRIALVGPTGVGKTTTVAKLAAHAAMKHNLRVALISLDTYRVGAQEQLAHYAKLIGVPMVTAHDRRSLREALDAFDDRDLVFIDTAGRGPDQAAAHCVQLRQMFVHHGIEVFITLAAATRRFERDEMLEAMGELSQLGARALILTKLDEAVALGSCLSLTHQTRLPLAFVTSGQRVPEDLAAAEPSSLATKLVDRVLQSSRFRPSPVANGSLPSFSHGVC